MKLYMFRAVPLPIITSLFTVHSALVYVIQVCRQLSSRTRMVPSVQWIISCWWAEELPETCRVSCRSKFGKLVHLVGFIIKKFVTMHGHMNVKLTYNLFMGNKKTKHFISFAFGFRWRLHYIQCSSCRSYSSALHPSALWIFTCSLLSFA